MEVRNFRAEMHTVRARIKTGHRTKPTSARHQGIPELLLPHADGGNHAQPRDYDCRSRFHATSTYMRRFTRLTVSSRVRMDESSSSVAWNLNWVSTATAISSMARESNPRSSA